MGEKSNCTGQTNWAFPFYCKPTCQWLSHVFVFATLGIFWVFFVLLLAAHSASCTEWNESNIGGKSPTLNPFFFHQRTWSKTHSLTLKFHRLHLRPTSSETCTVWLKRLGNGITVEQHFLKREAFVQNSSLFRPKETPSSFRRDESVRTGGNLVNR